MTGDEELDAHRRRAALKSWLVDCKQRMLKRFPIIDFEADQWPVKTIYRTRMQDVGLRPALADFSARDPSFVDALRCIAAELVMADAYKSSQSALAAFRMLSYCDTPTVFDIDISDFKGIEAIVIARCKANRSMATSFVAHLGTLSRQLNRLAQQGLIARLMHPVQRETRADLAKLARSHTEATRSQRMVVLDRQIEALCTAINASLSDDPRLSARDKVTLALMGLQMCAPSRINEVLCLATDDFVTLDDYVVLPGGQERDHLHSVHQMLVVTMKGSKGAQWGAKPILSFMIDLFNHCLRFITKHGERSRRLAEWYESKPEKVYLPKELEHLRGSEITRANLWRIMNLRTDRQLPISAKTGSPALAFNALRSEVRYTTIADSEDPDSRLKRVQVLPWRAVETYLLARVHRGMSTCRKVTMPNWYEGKLSKMLFLFDTDETPYIPSSLKYGKIFSRLRQTEASKHAYQEAKGTAPEPTVFEKLGITMPVGGRVQVAEIGTHDPRRWLTTQALASREKLSDVLINKWARRLNLEQLRHYDFRTAEQKADQAANLIPQELRDLSKGIESLLTAESAYGLDTEIVTIHDAGVSVTSMDAVAAAVDTRPIARTSEQVLIIYPSWYGACVHQQHETPCRAYSSCLPCDNNIVVKGHLPTNDAIRKRHRQLQESIVRQLESQATAHNRGVPDDPEALAAHLLLTVERGLDPDALAEDLISRFHEVKHSINDASLRIRLEEAFVAKGYVLRLDNVDVPAGALIKYHNPSRHASPGVERAFDSHGGREKLERDRKRILKTHPQFAATSIGLFDQRSLASIDEGEEHDA